MRPIISNIETASYEIAKYLNKLFNPLSKSEHNILKTEDLTRGIREETIPAWYTMISFDVENLLTNVLLDKNYKLYFVKDIRWEENSSKHSPNSLKRIIAFLHQIITFHFQ